MKKIRIIIISVSVFLGCSAVALAQMHRHTERTDSLEAIILDERSEAYIDINRTRISIDDEMEDLREAFDVIDEVMKGIAPNEKNSAFLSKMMGGTITICAMIFAFLVLLLVFGLPIIIIVGIFWLIWLLVRPSKKEKKEQATDPSIVTINAEPQDEALVKRKIAKKEPKGRNKKMEKAIMNIFVGMGLFFASLIIQMQLLTAISAFLIFFGVGELVIAKFLNKDDEKSE